MRSNPLDILKLALESREPIALVAVTDINGGTLRSKGALMAVTTTKAFGYISAGCVDGDIIFQARQSLENGQVRHLVYGEGSPFKDISLPCGGTINVSVFPNPDRNVIKAVISKTTDRQPAILCLSGFEHEYTPELSLRIVGRGAPFVAMADLAQASGFSVHGQSPDPDLAQDNFFRFDHLKDPSQTFDCYTDPWSAVVFLFHDHDWEPALLRQALLGDSFYIGAMGSERTHALRLTALQEYGVANSARIRGPIGLIPAMRDARTLAVSVLAEIIETAQQQGRLS